MPRGEHQLVKTHCPQGHPYDDENTYVPPSGGRCNTGIGHLGDDVALLKKAIRYLERKV